MVGFFIAGGLLASPFTGVKTPSAGGNAKLPSCDWSDAEDADGAGESTGFELALGARLPAADIADERLPVACRSGRGGSRSEDDNV